MVKERSSSCNLLFPPPLKIRKNSLQKCPPHFLIRLSNTTLRQAPTYKVTLKTLSIAYPSRIPNKLNVLNFVVLYAGKNDLARTMFSLANEKIAVLAQALLSDVPSDRPMKPTLVDKKLTDFIQSRVRYLEAFALKTRDLS